MPKKAKLSKKDLKIFKDLLIKEKINLLKNMNHLTNETLKKSLRDASGDLSGYAYHMADMASDVYERDFLLQLAASERELFLKLDEALRRIEEGEYGYCMNCKKKITKTRLKAIPHTPYCHGCQEKEEKKKKKKQ
ncbi:MAG: TraR/DksA C4-type zinc finger protein [Candidatus Omnitrophota bacterium]|nr:MAG: TraR/DksA C4-type zinc finger protein [Candidatus Omnitrophota bacterium]